ncbi:hypothetical protein FRC02_004562 [Tulasnella sp. 418]|nr:hypothetical protein FRC02_004562 [Tulasnella sp. 418]
MQRSAGYPNQSSISWNYSSCYSTTLDWSSHWRSFSDTLINCYFTHTTVFHPQLSFPKMICVSDRACSRLQSSTTPLRATALGFFSANNESKLIERSIASSYHPAQPSSSSSQTPRTPTLSERPNITVPFPSICAQALLFIFF